MKTTIKIHKSDLGDKWPFTVDKVTVFKAYDGALIIFCKKGKYALNGIASGRKKIKIINMIWLDDPEIPGLKKSLSPVFTYLTDKNFI